MSAEVVCSGWYWKPVSSVHSTPMRDGVEQLGDLCVVLQVRACRVAPGVAPAPVLLAEQPGERGLGRRAGDRFGVLVDEAPLLADPVVPVLGERLGHLDAQPVQQQVLLVLVRGEQLGGALRDGRAHRHDVERRVVGLARDDRSEEVGDAQERLDLLAGEREAGQLGGARLVGPQRPGRRRRRWRRSSRTRPGE